MSSFPKHGAICAGLTGQHASAFLMLLTFLFQSAVVT